ncbi:unnamed protein product, partial [Allacma fusca]
MTHQTYTDIDESQKAGGSISSNAVKIVYKKVSDSTQPSTIQRRKPKTVTAVKQITQGGKSHFIGTPVIPAADEAESELDSEIHTSLQILSFRSSRQPNAGNWLTQLSEKRKASEADQEGRDDKRYRVDEQESGGCETSNEKLP